MKENAPQLELKRFAQDNLIVLVRIVVASVIAIGLTILIARGLGDEGKGIYELSIYLPNLLVNVLFNFGLPASLSYYIARKDFSFDTTLSGTNFLNLVLSVLATLSGILIILLFGNSLFGTVPAEYLYAGLALMPMMLVIRHASSIFRGLEDFRMMGLIDSVQPLISLAVFFIFVFTFEASTTLALLSLAIGYGIASVYVLYLLARYATSKHALLPDFNYHYLKTVLGYGFQVYATIIVNNLLLRADVLLLNIWGQGVASVGIYSIAVALVERVWTLSSFNNTVLMPRIASWKDDKERQGIITAISLKYSFWLSLLIGLALLLLGKPFILLTVGAEFESAFYAILALLPGIIFYNIARPLGSNMIGVGDSRRATFYCLLALMINLVLNYLLIPPYDFVGAGIASSLAYGVYSALMLWDFMKRYQLGLFEILLLNEEDFRRIFVLVTMLRARIFSGKDF